MACNRCNDGYGGENKPWEKCGLLVCLIIVEILQMQLSSYSNYELDAPHNPSVLSVTLREKTMRTSPDAHAPPFEFALTARAPAEIDGYAPL